METKAMTLMKTMMLMCVALMLGLVPALTPAQAQDGFSPKAYVNARVISQYEFKQRVLFMTLLRQPGDISSAALSSLIDDSLRRQAAKALDVTVTPDQVQAGMAEFAARTTLPLDEFLKALAGGGVEPETLRDFVEAGLLWRAVIRARFVSPDDPSAPRITDAQIDRAIGAGAASGGELRLLLSEIVLPTGGAVNAMALAQRLKQTATTPQTFSMAARNYSKSGSAAGGGVLGWIPVSALPPAIAARVLALEVGEVTEPISVPGAVQMFLLRDKSLSGGEVVGAPQVDYAQFFAPAGTDLAAVRAGLDTCDDLYDAARLLPVQALQRTTVPESAVPPALRGVMADLDVGETAVVSGTLVMLCARMPQSAIPASRDDIATTLLNSKLALMAAAYLTELKSNAIIKVQ